MTNETFKKMLNYSELYIFERLEREINEYIKREKNRIAALENLVFKPKKDGSEKQNFALNFELKQGAGINTQSGKFWRFVDAWYDVNTFVNGQPKTGVKVKFWSLGDAPYSESFEEYIYFSWTDLKKILGYDLSEHQEKINAKMCFELFKNYSLPQAKEHLQSYEKHLKELPKDFKNLVECANKIEALYKSIKNSVASCWAYRNFKGGNELHYLIKDN